MQPFVKKYDENVKVAKACGWSLNRKLKTLMHGRPLMVGPIIDEKVRKSESVKNVVFTTTWGRSLLQRIGFRRWPATTSKVEIADSAKKEAGLQHHYHITSIVEKHKILESLVINSKETPSKYVQVECFIIVPEGAKKVGVAGITETSPSH